MFLSSGDAVQDSLVFEYTYKTWQQIVAVFVMWFCFIFGLWMFFSTTSVAIKMLNLLIVLLPAGYWTFYMTRVLLFGNFTGLQKITLSAAQVSGPKWSLFEMWRKLEIEYISFDYKDIKSIEAFSPNGTSKRVLFVTSTQGTISVNEPDLGAEQFELLVNELRKRRGLAQATTKIID